MYNKPSYGKNSSYSKCDCRFARKQHILSAKEIQTKLEKQIPDLNKTTVYRALDKLMEEGKVCRQIFGDDRLMYELRDDHHHDHLVCENCSKVEQIPCQTDRKGVMQGFQINHHHTTLFGICKICQMIKN